MKPIFVQAIWSECNLFEEKAIYEFEEFEAMAAEAVKSGRFGYMCKTSVCVLCDTGDRFEFRLDLSEYMTCIRDWINSVRKTIECDGVRSNPVYRDVLPFYDKAAQMRDPREDGNAR